MPKHQSRKRKKSRNSKSLRKTKIPTSDLWTNSHWIEIYIQISTKDWTDRHSGVTSLLLFKVESSSSFLIFFIFCFLTLYFSRWNTKWRTNLRWRIHLHYTFLFGACFFHNIRGMSVCVCMNGIYCWGHYDERKNILNKNAWFTRYMLIELIEYVRSTYKHFILRSYCSNLSSQEREKKRNWNCMRLFVYECDSGNFYYHDYMNEQLSLKLRLKNNSCTRMKFFYTIVCHFRYFLLFRFIFYWSY